jgi:hypothetical protein
VVFIFHKRSTPSEELADVSLEYVMGLLSSRAMLAYYILRFGKREWRSFPYVTQKILKKLPLRNPNTIDGGRELHDELSALVRAATEAEGPISKSLDLGIEDVVCKVYGFETADRERVMAVLESVQELRIIREVLR